MPVYLLYNEIRVLVIIDAYDHQSTLFSKYAFTGQCPPEIKEYARFYDEWSAAEGDPDEIELRYKDVVRANWAVEYQDGTTYPLPHAPGFMGEEISWLLKK